LNLASKLEHGSSWLRRGHIGKEAFEVIDFFLEKMPGEAADADQRREVQQQD
jgi:hypothetical protein